MKKFKFVKLGIVVGLSLTIMGCSSSTSHGLDKNHPITLQLWNYYGGAQKVSFDRLVEDFNQTLGKENGILINAVSMGSIGNIQEELQNTLDKKANAKKMPDMFSTYADTAEAVNQADLLVPLETYLDEKEMDTFVNGYLEEGRLYQEEEIKIFPVAKASEVFILNETDWNVFAKATGADINKLATWEGVNEVAEQYYKYSNKAFFARDALMNYLNTGSAQLGSELFTIQGKDATFTVKKEVMKKLWDNYYIPYVKGYYKKTGKFASDDIKTNDIIASVSSSAGATYFPTEIALESNQTKEITYKVLPIPNFAGCKPYATSQGAGIAVTKSDEAHEYASFLFLKWLSEPTQNVSFTASGSYLPVTKEATDFNQWKELVAKDGVTLTPLVIDTIRVSLDQVNHNTLYSSQIFKHSYQARTYLEEALFNKAEEDQKAVEEAIRKGVDRDKALQGYLSEAYFTTWFDTTSKDLNAILQGETE